MRAPMVAGILAVAACGRVGFAHEADAGSNAQADAVAIPACTVAACPVGFVVMDGGCYHVVDVALDWLAAEKQCESVGAHLVVVDSVAEHNTIHGLAGVRPKVWLGWSDRHFEDNLWLWVAPSAGGLTQDNPCVFGDMGPNGSDANHCASAAGPNNCPDHYDDNCASPLPYVCECDGHPADPNTY